jgi:hypothetical protein
MHTLLLFVAGVMCVCAVITILSLAIDNNLTPVGKTFSSGFVGCCAVLLVLLVMRADPATIAAVSGVAMVQHFEHPAAFESGSVALPDDVIEAPRAVSAAPVVAAAPVAAAAPVMVAQAPASDSTKDMLLGGALGYMLGSSGRQSAAPAVQSVTSHTTVIHNAPSPPHEPAPLASTPRPASPAAPAAMASAPKVAPVAPRPTFKSTFSMTRSGRR